LAGVSSLAKLLLKDNNIKCEAAKEIVNLLSQNTQLKVLDYMFLNGKKF